jgi:tyrosyl-tRNA synthetase
VIEPQEQVKLITRHCQPFGEFEARIKKDSPLRVKFGIDPTGKDIHLGHTICLRKLKTFQELGHKIVLIIGDFTARIGDPTGRTKSRTPLSKKEIEENMKHYLSQISKVINLNETDIHYNSEWFDQLYPTELLELMQKFTVQQIIERDDFTNRLKGAIPIGLNELLYPILQAQDSVEIRADVEIGGNDQLFNMMLARDLQRNAGQVPQSILSLPILRGTDGKIRMGKSIGNHIGVNEPPFEMFSKVMSIPDNLIWEWITHLTDNKRTFNFDSSGNLVDPMKAKKDLSQDIVEQFHGKIKAEQSNQEWTKRFTLREDPEEIMNSIIPMIEAPNGKIGILRLLVILGFASSNNEARNLITPVSGVRFGPEKIKIINPNAKIDVYDGLVIRVGKRKIAKLTVENY